MDKVTEQLIKDLNACNIVTESESKDEDCIPAAVKSTVCYIVATVIIKDGLVLMIKEARADCFGAWYLPAGKSEPNEPILDAAVREALEETGLHVKPTSLLAVESAYGGFWYRFTFAAIVTGGELKDRSKKDMESIEAAWIPIDTVKNKKLKLRAKDAIRLIELADTWYKSPKNQPKFHSLPVLKGHMVCKVRIFLLQGDENKTKVFVATKSDGTAVIPEVKLDRICSSASIEMIMESTLQDSGFYGNVVLSGIISVEHCPSQFFSSQGICFNVVYRPSSESLTSFHQDKGKFVDLIGDVELLYDILKSNACVDTFFR